VTNLPQTDPLRVRRKLLGGGRISLGSEGGIRMNVKEKGGGERALGSGENS